LKFLEFGFVFGNHSRIERFSWRVTTSFPGVTKLEQFDSNRVAFDFNAEFCLDFLGELTAIPGSIFKQFSFKERCDFGCDFGRLTWGLPISESFNAVLVESVEVGFNGAAAAFEMLNKPCDWVAFAAESNDTGSELNFWIDAWGAFEDGEFNVLFFGQGDEAMRISHMLRIHSGDT
jgi:hypothetical protein